MLWDSISIYKERRKKSGHLAPPGVTFWQDKGHSIMEIM
jgi:hypothetical protein